MINFFALYSAYVSTQPGNAWARAKLTIQGKPFNKIGQTETCKKN